MLFYALLLSINLLMLYLQVILPWQLHWGAIDSELARAMGGDEVVKAPEESSVKQILTRMF